MKRAMRITEPSARAMELQAANLAFSALELELRRAACEAQDACLGLSKELEQLRQRGRELVVSLSTSQADCAARSEQVQALTTELEQLQAHQLALSEDARVRLSVSASTQQGLQAELASASAARLELEAQLSRQAQESAQLASVIAERERAAAAAAGLQARVAELESELRDSDLRHTLTRAKMREASDLQQASLIELRDALKAQQVQLAEAEIQHESHTRQLTLALVQREGLLAELNAQIAAAMARATEAQNQLLRQGQDSVRASQQHAAELIALRDTMRRERWELNEQAGRREEAIRAAAQQREAELAAAQASSTADLRTQMESRRADWQSLVSALEARLSELRGRETRLESQAHDSRQALVAYLNEHRSAMDALSEARDLQQRKWLQLQSCAQAGILETLLARLDRDAQVELTLREEIAAHLRALASTATRTPHEQTDPMPPLLELQQELLSLRESLEDERQASASLSRQLSELVAMQAATFPVPAPAADPPAPPPADSLPPELPPPAALDEEKTAMTHPRTPDQLLGLYDVDFVRQAYLTVLRREPEEAGLQNCLTQLRSGVSKEALLLALAHSPEGRQRKAAGPEILALHQRAERLRGNLLARMLRRLLGLDSAGLASRVDAIDNRLGTALAEVAQEVRAGRPRAEQLEGTLRTLEKGLARQSQQAESQAEALQRSVAEQLSNAVTQMNSRMAEIDHKIVRLEAAVARLSQAGESTIARIDRAREVTREEARLTRAVMAVERSLGPAREGDGAGQAQGMEPSALARVREMLTANGEAA